ncbi:MAG: hypothetical protein ABJC62_05370 [Frankiaceae bacterium]|jgi:hypothetical protein
MPTTRPRHLITETDEVARALDDAAKQWPTDRSRAKLLLRLVEAGHRAVMDERAARVAERRAAIARTSGALTGAYGKNYLRDLREDWPE